jgi:hypothetical protein
LACYPQLVTLKCNTKLISKIMIIHYEGIDNVLINESHYFILISIDLFFFGSVVLQV